MDNREFCNEVWAFDCSEQKWYPISPARATPAPRIEPAVAFDGANNRMIVFGGYGDHHFNDVWALDLTMVSEVWNVLTTTGAPSPRTGLRAIIDAENNRFIFFGGNNGQVTYNETWSLNLNSLSWSLLQPAGTLPSPRWAHSAVYDSKQPQTLPVFQYMCMSSYLLQASFLLRFLIFREDSLLPSLRAKEVLAITTPNGMV